MRPIPDPPKGSDMPVSVLARRRGRLAVGALAVALALGAASLAPANHLATFSVEPDRPVVRDEPVTFTASTACEAPVVCTWSGSDGLAGTGRQIVRSFPEVGSPTVTLTVVDPAVNSGEPEVYEREVLVVNQEPEASFASVADGLAVAFTAEASDADGDSLTYEWDFGDDTPIATARNPRHVYAAAGTYDVTLSVSDSYTTTAHRGTVTVVAPNQRPTAAFDFTTDGLAASFDASDSSDPESGALTYQWNFGDGTTATGRVAAHVYPTSGPFRVTLTVLDPQDEPHSVTRDVLVNRVPVVSVTAGTQRAAAGESVTFTSTASDPDSDDRLTRVWEIDGVVAPEDTATVTRTFATAGRHTARLRVTDDHRATATAEAVVEVVDARPIGVLTATPSSPLTGEPVILAVSSQDPDRAVVAYDWDLDGDDSFTDGSGATLAPVSFATPETRVVRVRMTDDRGGQVFESLRLEIRNRPPSADFTWTPSAVERDRPVTFTSRASDPEGLELEQSWDLDGDGAYDDAFGADATHTFRSGGTHEVGLRVRDPHGAVTVVRLPVVLGNRAPVAAFSVSPERPVAGQTLVLTSQSTDSDGTVSSLAWDLDGDGAFDDASGPRAERRVTAAGRVTLGLRVVDDRGGVDVTQRTVEVAATGQQARPVPAAGSPKLLKPFPSVRVAGRLTRSGAVFRLVSVRAPRGARVAWSCSSRRCRSGSRTARGATMRIRALERSFPAGVSIEFRVTRRGSIGKYTRIKVRRSRAPGRRDLCLRSASARPFACPS